MNYADALDIAQSLVAKLCPLCDRIEIAGSIRRRKPVVGDIDLVLIPRSVTQLVSDLWTHYGKKPEKCGEKIIVMEHYQAACAPCREIQVDLYLATPKTWATLLLIRTGCKDHNIMLARRAMAMQYQLKANGEGLWSKISGQPIAIESEAQLFSTLGMKYREPWEREC